MKKIYLASSSKARKEVLEKINIPFEICDTDYEEDMSLDLAPGELAHELSLGKAISACKHISDGLIISADTFISCEGELLGKPKTDDEAREMLEKISGQCIISYTGVSVVDAATKKHSSNHCRTEVKIKKLSKEEIENYIASGEPIGKAGAFGIQGIGSLIVERINGDYNSIIALPLFVLHKELKKFGVRVL